MNKLAVFVACTFALVAAQPAAADRNPLVVGAEQSQTRIVMLDPDVVAPEPAKIVWEWRPSKDAKLAAAGLAGRFGNPSECKPSEDGKRILVCASDNGFAVVDVATTNAVAAGFIKLPDGKYANLHSICELPDGNVVVAGSQGGGLVVVDVRSKPFSVSPAIKTNEYRGAHGVLWDEKRKCLWATGEKPLTRFFYDAETMTLRRDKSWDTKKPFSLCCGHDLVWGNKERSRVAVTLGNGIACLDLDDADKTDMMDIAEELPGSVKGISYHGGERLAVYMDKTAFKGKPWTTVNIHVDGGATNRVYTLPGCGFYKAHFFLGALEGLSAGRLPPPTVELDGMRCWHDVAYGPRGDLPDEGEGFRGARGGWTHARLPWKFHRHRSGQMLDVYAPTKALRPDATVALYLHGGSWSECYDKDAPPGGVFKALVDAGAVACSADYILQNLSGRTRKEATFAEMLRDIDAATAKIKEFVGALGVTDPRLVIFGESAGGHLSLMYAYDQDNPGWTGLGLSHSPRVSKVVNIVGPTDFTAREFRNLGVVKVFGLKFKMGSFEKLLKRLLGLEDGASEEETLAAAEKWSPLKLVCPKSVPTAIACGAIGKDGASDGLIPFSQMTALESALKSAGVPCVLKKFKGAHHGEVTSKGAAWIAAEVLKQ